MITAYCNSHEEEKYGKPQRHSEQGRVEALRRALPEEHFLAAN